MENNAEKAGDPQFTTVNHCRHCGAIWPMLIVQKNHPNPTLRERVGPPPCPNCGSHDHYTTRS
jgi:hypothetical protein